MMKVLLVIFSLFALVSCGGSVKTISADLLTGALSSAIVTAATCSDAAAVRADVKVQVDSWFKIQAQEKGIVQDLCKTAIENVVPSLVGATLKSSWQCKLTTISDASKLLSEMACKSL